VSLLPFLLVALAVVGFIVWPLLAPQTGQSDGRELSAAARSLREQARLIEERNAIYATIRDLDFDYQTGKLPGDEYAARRHQLVARGVEALKQLDALEAVPAHDPVEAALAQLRDEVDQPTSSGKSY
jgi:hypothetical protein